MTVESDEATDSLNVKVESNDGSLYVPSHVKSVGLGGALCIAYACNGCASQWALFETSSKYELGCATKMTLITNLPCLPKISAYAQDCTQVLFN